MEWCLVLIEQSWPRSSKLLQSINRHHLELSYCFLLYCQYFTIFQFSPYFVMHFHFCNVTWNETWNVPMFRADNIASLTDSCPRNINIKHRKSVSLSISAFTNTASHQAVGRGMFCVRNVYCHFRSKFISRQAPIQRNIKINANRPESAASFCATSSHHRVAIQLLIVGRSERKTSKTSFGDVIRWWEMPFKSKYYALGCLHVKGLYKRGLERASEYLLVSSQFVHWDSKIKQYLV